MGNRIYIHYHRCTDFILVMDVTDPDRVTLSKVCDLLPVHYRRCRHVAVTVRVLCWTSSSMSPMYAM